MGMCMRVVPGCTSGAGAPLSLSLTEIVSSCIARFADCSCEWSGEGHTAPGRSWAVAVCVCVKYVIKRMMNQKKGVGWCRCGCLQTHMQPAVFCIHGFTFA